MNSKLDVSHLNYCSTYYKRMKTHVASLEDNCRFPTVCVLICETVIKLVAK